jgi:hypothetical protein
MKLLLAATTVVALVALPSFAQDTKYDPSRGDTVQKPSTPVTPGVSVVRPRTDVQGGSRESGNDSSGGSTSGASTGSDSGGGSGGSGGGSGGTK